MMVRRHIPDDLLVWYDGVFTTSYAFLFVLKHVWALVRRCLGWSGAPWESQEQCFREGNLWLRCGSMMSCFVFPLLPTMNQVVFRYIRRLWTKPLVEDWKKQIDRWCWMMLHGLVAIQQLFCFWKEINGVLGGVFFLSQPIFFERVQTTS